MDNAVDLAARCCPVPADHSWMKCDLYSELKILINVVVM